MNKERKQYTPRKGDSAIFFQSDLPNRYFLGVPLNTAQ